MISPAVIGAVRRPVVSAFGRGRSGGAPVDPLAFDFNPAFDQSWYSDENGIWLQPTAGPPIAFSRSSPGTFTDADGLVKWAPENLLYRANEFTHGVWTGQVETPLITADHADGPSSLRATRLQWSTGGQLNQSFSPATGVLYTGSVWMRSNTGSNQQVYLFLYFGSGGTNYGEQKTLTTEWQRFDVTAYTSVVGAGAVFQIRSASGVTDILVAQAQLERSSEVRDYIHTSAAPVYGPRFEHDPITGRCLGLLIEEARTNRIAYSSDFSQWTRWGGVSAFGSGSVSDAVTAPDGTQTADTINVASYPGGLMASGGVTAGTQVTASFYAKRGTMNTPKFSVWNNNASSFIVPLTDYNLPDDGQWHRQTVTFTVPSGCTSAALRVLNDTGTGTIHLWGAQMEGGAFASSLIQTNGASVTREADVAGVADVSGVWNTAEMTVVAETRRNGMLTVNNALFQVVDAVSLFHRVAQGNRLTTSFAGGTYTLPAGGNQAGSPYRSAIAIKDGIGAFVVDGSIAFNDLPGSPGTPGALLMSGSILSGQVAGTIFSRLRFFKKRLPDAELQALTTPE